jgi:hypothetical protein
MGWALLGPLARACAHTRIHYLYKLRPTESLMRASLCVGRWEEWVSEDAGMCGKGGGGRGEVSSALSECVCVCVCVCVRSYV